MRKLCAISGMPLITASHFSNYFTRSVHPLLEVKTVKLLELAGSKSWMDWTDQEAKLLFLAIANSLQLIEVTEGATANPSQQLIASSIEMLVMIAGWHSIREFQLPTYRIRAATDSIPSNEAMLEFPSLLTSIIVARSESIEDHKRELEAIRLEETIRVLYAKCSIGANKTKMLRTKTADWAIKITLPAARKERVSNEIQQLWHQMLVTAPVDAHRFSNTDIQELDEFMTCNLPHGCTASYEVMKHLTAMKNATTQLVNFLGIDNVIRVIEDAPTEAPVEANYNSKLEFLVAKAKYQQSLGAKEAPAAEVSNFQVLEEQELPIDTNEGEDETEEEEGDINDYL